ncbi:adenylate kinase [mine drainage metagenome]|uniref:Adenylate kinase n=2 Tax=mine drainage metagenome TaxID=410659 RepID=T1DIC7_9ZZZZ
MRSIISGVAGVGKSTILYLVEKGTNYDIINFGTLMYEMARDIGLIAHRDELRKLNVDTQINLQKKASNAIGQMDEVIVDTHMSIRSPKGYIPGLPEWVLRELKINSYFVIESDYKEIKKRRASDSNRFRDEESEDDIKLHQELNRYFVAAYAIYSAATVNFVNNVQDAPEVAANEIIRKLMKND